MTTENWMLLVTITALLWSIGIPVWHGFSGDAQKADSKKTLLLQRILDTKAIHFSNLHELNDLLQKHGPKMERDQRMNLEAAKVRVGIEIKELENRHKDYSDGSTLKNLEQKLAEVNMLASLSSDLEKLIEKGAYSYRNT